MIVYCLNQSKKGQVYFLSHEDKPLKIQPKDKPTKKTNKKKNPPLAMAGGFFWHECGLLKLA